MQRFLGSGLWDDLYLYRSPMVIGAGGLDAPCFDRTDLVEEHVIGDDRLEIRRPKA